MVFNDVIVGEFFFPHPILQASHHRDLIYATDGLYYNHSRTLDNYLDFTDSGLAIAYSTGHFVMPPNMDFIIIMSTVE